MIESYTFGKMIINGKEYRQDVILHPEQVEDNWWRKSGHELCVEDIEKSIERSQPEVVVVGTGKYGIMKVLAETKQYLSARGIELIAEKTDKAYKTYNRLSQTKKVIGAFHLTC